MRQLFHIKNDSLPVPGNSLLVFESGSRHCCFGVIDDDKKQLEEYVFYTSEDPEEDFITKIFDAHPELSGNFSHEIISFGIAENIMIPEILYKEEEAPQHLQLIFGKKPDNSVLSVYQPPVNLYTVFRVPGQMHKFLERKFDTSVFHHTHSAYLKNINGNRGDEIVIDFRPDEMNLLVFKNGILQLGQSFTYATPDDVLYYLLKICRSFSIAQQDVKLELSGFIEKDSAIYRELHKYFLQLEFASVPQEITLAAGFRDYPGHYFSTLCKLAACV